MITQSKVPIQPIQQSLPFSKYSRRHPPMICYFRTFYTHPVTTRKNLFNRIRVTNESNDTTIYRNKIIIQLIDWEIYGYCFPQIKLTSFRCPLPKTCVEFYIFLLTFSAQIICPNGKKPLKLHKIINRQPCFGIESDNIQMQKVNNKHKDKVNIKSDFKEFFIAQTGSSQIKQAEFEQVSASETSESSDDFKEQDYDQVEQKGIKTFQFWNGIKLPKDSPKISNEPVQWKLSCPFSFGFNSLGRDNLIYIEGSICKAFGCLLILNGQIYNRHNKKITTLAFNPESSQLLSASQSPAPEFFLWQYHSSSRTLQFTRRFVVGCKSQDIYSVCFFRQFVVCVELFTLHKNSTMHCYTVNDGNKVSSFKVGKFYDLELLNSHQGQDMQVKNQEEISKNRLFYSNDEGIWQLVSQQSQTEKDHLKTQKIHESDNVCCLLPYHDQEDLEIMYGDKEGKVNLVYSKQSLKVHDGWIFQLKNYRHKHKNYFFALGAMDLMLSVIEHSHKKIKIIRKLQLGGYGRGIEIENQMLLIGKRDGDLEEFNLRQLIEKKEQEINSKKSASLKCFESKDKKREFFFEVDPVCFSSQKETQPPSNKSLQYPTKSYLYGHSKSKNITFFTIANKSIQNVQSYPLRYYPKSIDLKSKVIAYIYCVEKQEQQLKSVEFSKTLKNPNKKIQKLVLVLQDPSTKTLIAKIPLQAPISITTPTLSVTLKFSPSGNMLALADPSGNLLLLPKTSKGIFAQQFIKSDKQTHKQPIQQITWSKDENFIKTISEKELHYWEISGKENSEIKLLSVKSGQTVDVIWNQISKFGWQTKNVWESTDLVGDIYKFWGQQHTAIDVVETKSKKQVQGVRRNVIGCIRNDGFLRIYNYPAKGAKRQEIRMNNEKFEVHPYSESCERFCFFIIIEGMLALIQLDQ